MEESRRVGRSVPSLGGRLCDPPAAPNDLPGAGQIDEEKGNYVIFNTRLTC
jgi:hypothetical protein